MRIRARKVEWGNGISFFIHEGNKLVTKMKFEEQRENFPILNMERMSNEDAQLLMDDLWDCGFRPTEGTGSAGAMAATQSHLKDLQRLVFKEKVVK